MHAETGLNAAGTGESTDRSLAVQIISVSQVFRTTHARDVVALRDVSIDVPKGQFLCLLGPSGCGKSTLLNAIAGLIKPSRGSISIDGDVLQGVNTAAGYMTQADTVLPWRTVESNICFPLEVRKVPRRRRSDMAKAAIELVDLAGFESHYPYQLSGGMRRRVLLARTLVYSPQLLLMDEPFGSLDAQLRLTLQEELLRVWEQEQRTVIFVTHDIDEALLLSDRVVMLAARPGRVIDDIETGFGRPRSLQGLRESPEYGRLHNRLMERLRQ